MVVKESTSGRMVKVYQVEWIYTTSLFGKEPRENVEEWKAHSLKKKKKMPGDCSSRLSVDARHRLAANWKLQRVVVSRFTTSRRSQLGVAWSIFAQRNAFSVTICACFIMKMCHPVVIKLPKLQSLQSFPCFLFILLCLLFNVVVLYCLFYNLFIGAFKSTR